MKSEEINSSDSLQILPQDPSGKLGNKRVIQGGIILACVLMILGGIGLGVGVIGVAGFGAHRLWWSAGALSQLGQFGSIGMMAAGGVGGILFTIGIIVAVKSYITLLKMRHASALLKQKNTLQVENDSELKKKENELIQKHTSELEKQKKGIKELKKQIQELKQQHSSELEKQKKQLQQQSFSALQEQQKEYQTKLEELGRELKIAEEKIESSKRRDRKEEVKEEEKVAPDKKKVASHNALDFPPNSLLHKHTIQPHPNIPKITQQELDELKKNAKKENFWSSIWSYISSPIKAISDYLLGGGPLQQRIYYHLLCSLLDPISAFLGFPPTESAPVTEKIPQLSFYINKTSYFKFLINKEICKNELQEHLNKAFSYLLRCVNPNENFATLRYSFFQSLNAAWKSKEYQNNIQNYRLMGLKQAQEKFPEIAFMQMLGFAIFIQAHFDRYAEKAVFSVFQKGSNEFKEHPPSDTPITEIIHKDHESIGNVDGAYRGGVLFKTINQMEGHTNVFFSPLEKNNFSSVYWRAHYRLGDRSISPTCLRFGTPTTENFDDPEILPAMHLFLDYCAKNGLKIVSFQHQNPKEKGTLQGSEKNRLDKMFELAEKEEYKNTIVVIGLPMDGDFFQQENGYEEINNAQTFINSFLKELLKQGKDAWIRLPTKDSLKEQFPEYENELKTIVNTIHQLFFNNEKELSQEERKIFQIFTYAHLVEYFSVGLEADFFHCQCKDAQDRAIVLLATLYYLSMIRRGVEKDPDEIRRFRVMVEFACLMIKGMPLHDHRFPLLEKTIELLSNLSEDEKEVIRKTPLMIGGKECRLKDILIEENPNQTVTPIPSEATSIEKYHELVEKEKESVQFKVNYFVQSLLVSPQKEEELYEQFLKRDLDRLMYLIDSKPIVNNLEKELEEKGYSEELREKIVKLAKETDDSIEFLIKLKDQDKNIDSNSFKELYNKFREKSLKEVALKWALGDSNKAKKALALLQQGVLSNVSCMVMQRYRFIGDDGFAAVDIRQREAKDTSNTCFNYIEEKGRPIIEVYQLYEIFDVASKKTLYYLTTITKIDLKTGHATIKTLPPQSEAPQPITEIVKSMNRPVEELEGSFLNMSTL